MADPQSVETEAADDIVVQLATFIDVDEELLRKVIDEVLGKGTPIDSVEDLRKVFEAMGPAGAAGHLVDRKSAAAQGLDAFAWGVSIDRRLMATVRPPEGLKPGVLTSPARRLVAQVEVSRNEEGALSQLHTLHRDRLTHLLGDIDGQVDWFEKAELALAEQLANSPLRLGVFRLVQLAYLLGSSTTQLALVADQAPPKRPRPRRSRSTKSDNLDGSPQPSMMGALIAYFNGWRRGINQSKDITDTKEKDTKVIALALGKYLIHTQRRLQLTPPGMTKEDVANWLNRPLEKDFDSDTPRREWNLFEAGARLYSTDNYSFATSIAVRRENIPEHKRKNWPAVSTILDYLERAEDLGAVHFAPSKRGRPRKK